MAVSFEELDNSPTEGLDFRGFTATRVLKCAWADRQQLMYELLRGLYPVLSIPFLMCTRVSSAPFKGKNIGSGDTSAYQFAQITAEYGTPSQDEDDAGVRIAESIEPTAEFLTVANDNLRWTANDGDEVKANESPGKLFIGLDYILSKENIAAVPVSVLDLVGKVNATELRPTAQGLEDWLFPAETLLFNPPSIQRTFDEAGTPLWNVTYRFSYKPNKDETVDPPVERGWNWYWRVKEGAGEKGRFDRMFNKDGDQYLQYPTGDFTGL